MTGYNRMMEVKMVRNTVHKVGRHLAILANKRIPINHSFELLGRRASTLEELIVIEVMREVYSEMAEGKQRKAS